MKSQVFDPDFFVPEIEFSSSPVDQPTQESRGTMPFMPPALLKRFAAFAAAGALYLAAPSVDSQPSICLRVLGVACGTEMNGESTADSLSAFRELDQLRYLPRNWDSYGAEAPDASSIDAAQRFLVSLLNQATIERRHVPAPAVQASGARTVGLAWGTPDRAWTVEVEAHPDRVLTYVHSVGDHIDVGTVESAADILRMLRA